MNIPFSKGWKSFDVLSKSSGIRCMWDGAVRWDGQGQVGQGQIIRQRHTMQTQTADADTWRRHTDSRYRHTTWRQAQGTGNRPQQKQACSHTAENREQINRQKTQTTVTGTHNGQQWTDNNNGTQSQTTDDQQKKVNRQQTRTTT